MEQRNSHLAASGHALAVSDGPIDLFATIDGDSSTAAGNCFSALPGLQLVVQLVLIYILLPHLQVHVGWLPEGTAVFAFRGTDTAQDGLQDVKIMRRNIDYLQDLFPGVKAHVGGCCSASLLSTPVLPGVKPWWWRQKAHQGLCCGAHALLGSKPQGSSLICMMAAALMCSI